ncbi:MAG: putative DNA binding domain-containing protein [Bacteroidales bacterium]|nr:putative DNA binding domain-containing protein [Bacteroidales bacterium]
MALPININDLLNKRRVESNRIEFKKSWNPAAIYRTICAFANDFENLGGGYILVGVEQDEHGVAKRPVTGIELEDIDRIMQQMVGFDAKIKPEYSTRAEIIEIDDKYILAIWAPARNNRPYSVWENVTAKYKSEIKYYIRSKSSTIAATGDLFNELFNLANNTPFDERGNSAISINDISPILVYEHLKKIGSKLIESFNPSQLSDTLEAMELLTGPTEDRLIKNVAAMMFCEHPEKFFPVTQVDIVLFPEGSEENPDVMIEVPKITGPVPTIIRETLSYLKTNIIKQKITKPTDKEESDKVYNYPYQAFEEAVVNALYHRNYQEHEPVEITIEPDRVEILSHSGPDRSISDNMIKEARKLKTRKYRNRRLGDFLKELDLSEGRATGIPTIQKHLKANGSGPATIGTDDNRSFFLMTIPCRDGFDGKILKDSDDNRSILTNRLKQMLGFSFVQVEDTINQCIIFHKTILGQILEQMSVQVWNKTKSRINLTKMCLSVVDLLCILYESPMSANQLNKALAFGATYDLKRKVIIPLIQKGYITMLYPDRPTSANQAYKLTASGLKLFEL